MWKLLESLSTALLPSGDEQSSQQGSRRTGAGAGADAGMERGTSLVLGNVDGERVVEKLKGYFSLGKNEIDKAVRADEWGLLADALHHYRSADRILSEGVSAPAAVESSRCGEEDLEIA